MINTGKLAGKTILITGASRGIGKAIALKAASDGANIVIAAKTAEPHAKLPGTIYSAAEEVEKAGGKALPCIVDVRDEAQVKSAIKSAVEKFGGLDIVVNNASAIHITQTTNTDMKRFDLMHGVICRGTFMVAKESIPYLQKSTHAHILNIAPPINMKPHWFSAHLAYTIAKYGSSMCTIGLAEELKPLNIGVNGLWPAKGVHTVALDFLMEDSAKYSRKPEVMSDAAYSILIKDPKTCTGNFYTDETALEAAGITDLKPYANFPENVDKLIPDFYVDPTDDSPKASQSDSSASVSGVIPAYFKKIESYITPELIEKTGAVYQFDVLGDEAGVWHLDLKNQPGKVGRGPPSSAPDATLTMDSKDFVNIVTGKLKSANAFLTGKLKISGDTKKALKMEKLMSGLK